jgi:outer membrane protein TolC
LTVKPLFKRFASSTRPALVTLGLLGACASLAQTAGAGAGAGAFSSSSSPTSSSASNVSAAGDAAGLLALPPATGTPAVLTLKDAVERALQSAPDNRIAAERVAQQSAAVRRAWALVLPSASVGASYALTCTGGPNGVDCGDRTTSFVNQDTIDQQALLFDSLSDIIGVAADASTDAEAVAKFRDQQAQLKSTANDIRNTDTTPVVVQPASQLAGQLTVTVPLVNPRAYPALLNAYDGVQAAKSTQDVARQALVLAVVRTYHATVTAERLRQASERQVAWTTRQRDAVSARVQATTQPLLALQRAELEVLRARQTLSQTTASADNALGALAGLLGTTERFDVVAPPVVPPVASSNVDALVEQALAARPEVRAQRTALQVAERGTLDAWMQFMPTVGLSATARATSFTQGFVRDPVTGVLTLSASLPLYDGGVRYAALDDAASRTNEERIRLRQLEDRVASQVRGNIREVQLRQDSLALSRQALEVAQQAQANAQALFDAGVGTALDVSETNFAVFLAESDALRAELEVAQAALGLRWAVGELLVD